MPVVLSSAAAPIDINGEMYYFVKGMYFGEKEVGIMAAKDGMSWGTALLMLCFMVFGGFGAAHVIQYDIITYKGWMSPIFAAVTGIFMVISVVLFMLFLWAAREK